MTPPAPGPWTPRQHRPKTLGEVEDVLGLPRSGDDRALTGVSSDSRRVQPGHLYAALPGARHHGAEFAAEAAARGAVAALSDRACDPLPVVLRVADPRAALGPLTAWLYDAPSAAMAVYGVTGTNGKSSTVHLLDAGLTACGTSSGLLSGIVQRGPRAQLPSARTTPEAPELQQALAAFREQGVTAVAVEVSSHGLTLHRVAGTRFRAAVFTNLGRDHLDLHGDMDSYLAAKASLFEPDRSTLGVVAVDDDAGRQLAAASRIPVVTFSARGVDADWRADDVRATARGTSFRLRGPGADRPVRLRLLGAHQADNALGAVAALVATGHDLERAVAGVEGLPGVPGRLERVDDGQPFLAVVDHVHNTSGQQRVLPYLRSLTDGRLIVVVGGTGGRDRGKLFGLGRTAADHADTVVVTDESPHDDDPEHLRAEVAAGARAAGRAQVLVEADRARAIDLAVGCAAPGDVVLVAGRGHDPVLVAGGTTSAFDDRTALRGSLRRAVAAA